MAPQSKEIVVATHPLDPQQLTPQLRQRLLHLAFWRGIGTGGIGVCLRGWQGLAVHLPVWRQRKALQHHKCGRHHVGGQAALQVGFERGWQRGGVSDDGSGVHVARNRVRSARNSHISDKALLSGPLLSGQHDRITNALAGPQRRLDLAQFDAKAANLDLEVRSAQELQIPIRQPARQIARAIHPCVWLRRVGIGQEAFRRQLRAIQIPSGHTGTADVYLTGYADGHRLAISVKKVDALVGDRTADGDGGAFEINGQREHSCRHCGFRGSVNIEQPGGLAQGELPPCRQYIDRHDITADNQDPERATRRHIRLSQPVLHQRPPVDARDVDQCHGMSLELTREAARLQVEFRQNHLTPGNHGWKELLHRGVKRDFRHQRHPIRRPQPMTIAVFKAVGAHAAMLHHHPLGPACGSRGIDHIGQVIRPQANSGRFRIGGAQLRPGRRISIKIHQRYIPR